MENLQKLYTESKMTLSELSKITGISTSTIHRYVKGNIREINKRYYDPIMNALRNSNLKQTDVIDTNELKEKMLKNGIDNTAQSSASVHNIIQVTNKLPTRGEIWYVKGSSTVGKEMWTGSQNRPCVVLQNTKLGNIPTCLVVFLTKQPREIENPSLVTIKTNVMSTAICSQMNAISRDRFVNCLGKITDVEMSLIERAILTVLDIKINPKSEVQHLPDYIALKTELMVYKQLYSDYIKIHSSK